DRVRALPADVKAGSQLAFLCGGKALAAVRPGDEPVSPGGGRRAARVVDQDVLAVQPGVEEEVHRDGENKNERHQNGKNRYNPARPQPAPSAAGAGDTAAGAAAGAAARARSARGSAGRGLGRPCLGRRILAAPGASGGTRARRSTRPGTVGPASAAGNADGLISGRVVRR